MGGENIAANSLLFRSLVCGAELATSLQNVTLASEYQTKAAALKTAINSYLWDAKKGAFLDNPTSSVYPQGVVLKFADIKLPCNILSH